MTREDSNHLPDDPRFNCCGKALVPGRSSFLKMDTDEGEAWFHLDCVESLEVHDD